MSREKVNNYKKSVKQAQPQKQEEAKAAIEDIWTQAQQDQL